MKDHLAIRAKSLFNFIFILELIMLLALLGIGTHATITDLKIRKIYNFQSYSLLTIGTACQMVMVYWGAIDMYHVLASFALALATALGLWMIGFGSPGDAKFYWAAAVATPSTFFATTPPFSLQAGPFVIIFYALIVYLLFTIVWWLKKSSQLNFQSEFSNIKWFKIGWELSAILGLIMGFVYLVLDRTLTFVEALCSLVLVYRLFVSSFEEKHRAVLVIPGLGTLVYVTVKVSIYQWALILLATAYDLEVIYQLSKQKISSTYIQTVPINHLAAGAVLHETLRLSSMNQGDMTLPAGRPLKDIHIKDILTLVAQRKIAKDTPVLLEQPLPFVPFIVCGVLLAIWLS